MGIWKSITGLFGTSQIAGVKKELCVSQAQMFEGLGMSSGEAAEIAAAMIEKCWTQCEELGLDKVSAGLGDILLGKSPPQTAKDRELLDRYSQISSHLKSEGVNPGDVSALWNQHPLAVVVYSRQDDGFRFSYFAKLREQGKNQAEAHALVQKQWPLYQMLLFAEPLKGPDAPLPLELCDRVNKASQRQQNPIERSIPSTFSTFNAYIRSKIQEGAI